MLLILLCMLAAATAAPSYDQRQEGETNFQADLQNVVIVFVIPEKKPTSIFDGFFKNSKQKPNESAQERSEVQLIDAFAKPSKPYGVELSSEADGRAEVMIPGQRRFEFDIQPEKEELKPVSVTEACRPGQERDPKTLVCTETLPVTKTGVVAISS